VKAGTENRTKTIAAGVLGTCALIGVSVFLYNQFSNSPSTPPPTIAPVSKNLNSRNAELAEATAPSGAAAGGAGSRPAAMPAGNAPGVAAKKMASSSASLDPTLNQSAMLRTEQLVYAGSGRNIFSAIYVPPPKIPEATHPPRPGPPVPPVYTPPPGPPPPPPIPLKFFGTATRVNGARQAFLLQGDDVFLASQGDIVARRFRIVSISNNSVQVEDMANNNTQTLPLQSN
jgi:hypothetical protein